MKNKTITAVSTLMLFIPWTIFPLRSFGWALTFPAAEIIIACYAAFMIFSGVFTISAVARWHVRGTWMQVCAVINGIYAAVGATVLFLMIPNLIKRLPVR